MNFYMLFMYTILNYSKLRRSHFSFISVWPALHIGFCKKYSNVKRDENFKITPNYCSEIFFTNWMKLYEVLKKSRQISSAILMLFEELNVKSYRREVILWIKKASRTVLMVKYCTQFQIGIIHPKISSNVLVKIMKFRTIEQNK